MAPADAASRPARGWALALAAVLAGALALRLWGAGHGLPWAYNVDENAHFVPRAIAMFGHSYDPGYFINPPAYTYLLHAVFALWFGGREGVADAFAADPGDVFLVARVVSALLGTAAVGLLYLAGARLLGRAAGLLAAALLAVAFLPVHYAHLALNDAPALAPMCLALWACARIVDEGRWSDWVLAGAGVGLASATKYTAGIVALSVLAAALVARGAAPGRRAAAAGLSAVAALACFVAANPYALLDYDAFSSGLSAQASASAAGEGKLGLTQDSGWGYYARVATWGLGWLPCAAALGGAVALAARRPRAAALLVPPPVVFLLFMGAQERFFSRWLLPALPFLCLLAAWAALRAAGLVAERGGPRLRVAAPALAAVLLCAQGLAFSLHNDVVLSRPDTRNATRAWMTANVPAGSKVVIEPVVPDGWVHDPGRVSPATRSGVRWIKWPTLRTQLDPDGSLRPGPGRTVRLEDYERTTRPELLDSYARGGFCWVVSGSTQSGRAFADPGEVPRAVAYYAALRRRGELRFRAAPRPGGDRERFSFDFSFNAYPLDVRRPGPEMTVRRLSGGRCGPATAG